MTQQSVIIWLTRHPLPNEIGAAFPGHRIVHVKGRWTTLKDACRGVFDAAGCKPDVIFYVLPHGWIKDFLLYAARVMPDTRCVRIKVCTPGLALSSELSYHDTRYSEERQGVLSTRWQPESQP